MEVIAIHKSDLKSKLNTKLDKTASKKILHNNVVKNVNAFIFQMDGVKFALNLSCVTRSTKHYAVIHQFDDTMPHIVGFTFINNELVNILNLIEIIAFDMNPNATVTEKRLVEITYNKVTTGILVDDVNCETKLLQIAENDICKPSSKSLQFKCLEAILAVNSDPIFLLNERVLFNEIQKKINYNESTR